MVWSKTIVFARGWPCLEFITYCRSTLYLLRLFLPSRAVFKNFWSPMQILGLKSGRYCLVYNTAFLHTLYGVHRQDLYDLSLLRIQCRCSRFRVVADRCCCRSSVEKMIDLLWFSLSLLEERTVPYRSASSNSCARREGRVERPGE